MPQKGRLEGRTAERGARRKALKEFPGVKKEKAFLPLKEKYIRVWGIPQNFQRVSENSQERRETVGNPSTKPL